jgi:hypothetical protein
VLVFVEAAGKATRTEVRVVERGSEAERSVSSAVWRRWGSSVKDVLTPIDESSSGSVRIWRVSCMRVRGRRRVRRMLRSVECRRVSRWRSRGAFGCCYVSFVYLVC